MRGSAFSDDDGARGWFKRRRQRKRAQDLAEWQTRTHRSAFSESQPRASAGSAFGEPKNERHPGAARAHAGSRAKPHPRDERAMRAEYEKRRKRDRRRQAQERAHAEERARVQREAGRGYASSAQLFPTVPPLPYPASANAQQPAGATRVNTAPPPEAPKKKKDHALFWWILIVFVCFPAGFFLSDMDDEVSDPPPAEVESAQGAESDSRPDSSAAAVAPESGAQPLAAYAPVPQNLADAQAVRTEGAMPPTASSTFAIPAGHVFGTYDAEADSTGFYDTETGQLRYTLPGAIMCSPAGDTANMWCAPNTWTTPYASSYISEVPATLRAAADGSVIWESGAEAQSFAPGVLLSEADGREERFSWLSPTDGAVLTEVTLPASYGEFHVTPNGEVLYLARNDKNIEWTVFDAAGRTRGSGVATDTRLSFTPVITATDGWFFPEVDAAFTLDGKMNSWSALPSNVRVRAAHCAAPQASTAQLREVLETLLGQSAEMTSGNYHVEMSACTPGGLGYLSATSGTTTALVAGGQARELPVASTSLNFLPLGNGIVVSGYRADSRDVTFAFDLNQGEEPVWSVRATLIDAVPGYGFIGIDFATPDSEPVYYALRVK
ncbi:hypothetical protein ACXITP_00070 [Actinotignum sanguinis]|uniref:Uncharacterized protein n=5 Tax=Actinomycetaceae TaxID=2049 RepID=A0ABZ0RB77_9ACTO|nr:hypothetical protein [Actinotignum sanguinis]WPJ88690.1 hypothetical protein R0V15_07440 [Schaalia turicensis]MDE1552549.1 hypothetical protein [Actinotignum sanguinis]MDE1566098.1 hypothetical protein [Actinotignum sanguinis]MDE1576944.1 hypothetical protein [Actinotignum sanguinis]MDE1641987.1 hypothetical protein [Actinotignum sanguinis]